MKEEVRYRCNGYRVPSWALDQSARQKGQLLPVSLYKTHEPRRQHGDMGAKAEDLTRLRTKILDTDVSGKHNI